MILGYIDPGQGMLIWQAIVSAFVGVLFYLKKTRDFIIGLVLIVFRRKKSSPAAPAVSNAAPQKVSSVPVEAEVEAR